MGGLTCAIGAIGRNKDGLIEAAGKGDGGDGEFVTKTISTFQERENERKEQIYKSYREDCRRVAL